MASATTSPESGGTLHLPLGRGHRRIQAHRQQLQRRVRKTGGGFEVFTTKSGTNNWHGDLFDYLRNNVFDARGFYALSAPVNRQNEFGGAIGGPVRIPHVTTAPTRRSSISCTADSASCRTPRIAHQPAAGGLSQRRFLLAGRGRQPGLIYDPTSTASDGAGGFTRTAFPGK